MPNPVALDSLIVDCSSLGSFLVDLPPNGRSGMISTQPGYVDAVAEVETNQAKYGDAAGITKTDLDALTEANQRVAAIDQNLPALYKLIEVLEETRAKEDDKRQRLINTFAESIDRRARTNGDATLLAKYEKTRSYRSAVAMKAVKTRMKKAESKAEPTP